MLSTPIVHPFAGAFASSEPVPTAPNRYRCPAGVFELPISYTDVTSVMATFGAPLAQLSSLLPEPLRPRRVFGELGALVVQFLDIPSSSIGPYRECVVSIAVRDSAAWPVAPDDVAWDPLPCFPLWLAASTRLACECGQATWGYPKTWNDVEMERSGNVLRCTAQAGNDSSLGFTLTAQGASARSRVRLRSITQRSGRLQRNEVHGGCQLLMLESPELSLQVRPGSPITDALSALRLEGDALSCAYLHEFDYQLVAPNDEAGSQTQDR